ncbi:hypothetical protein FEM48_Zijuj10G0154300 [Ziziphus jujuba var. spinosa]|uniref:Clp R domain-containing protein n=1 Tax=Ziziphus jujuba var. spinosa TaxID=714518 RepID=A0A978UP68_ZIZJJ|nr:hypothetical protein FEM48_Zijuj10G0154300 [Ziziphus jujuba var. spinosa]
MVASATSFPSAVRIVCALQPISLDGGSWQIFRSKPKSLTTAANPSLRMKKPTHHEFTTTFLIPVPHAVLYPPQGLHNINCFNNEALAVIAHSIELAKEKQQHVVETEHLMRAILSCNAGLADLFLKHSYAGPLEFYVAGVHDTTPMIEATNEFIQSQPSSSSKDAVVRQGPYLESLIQRASELKNECGDKLAFIEQLVCAFAQDERLNRVKQRKLEEDDNKDLKDQALAATGYDHAICAKHGEIFHGLGLGFGEWKKKKKLMKIMVVRAFDGLATSDLTNGMRVGESEMFNSAQQSEEIR